MSTHSLKVSTLSFVPQISDAETYRCPWASSSSASLAYESYALPPPSSEYLPSSIPEFILPSIQCKSNIRVPLSLSARRGYGLSIEITSSHAPVQTQKGHLEPKAGSLPRRKRVVAPKPTRIQDPRSFDFSISSDSNSVNED
ncbi:hypothetical protein VKT23_002431 [Stygiomarasmius scandens]|uniref:Uncharacterized protein n=1 Tax=Marasmiellus scandens TaxID=2682957 RepID=A0ABR1K7J1_9AGAR